MRAFVRRFIPAVSVLLAPLTLAAAEPDNGFIFLPSSTTVGEIGTFGAFAVNPITGEVWTAVYGGTAEIRKINYDSNTGQYDGGTTYVDTTDLADFGRSVNDYQSRPDWSSGTLIMGGVALNPTAITIDGHTYAPGTLLYVVSGGGTLSDQTGGRVDHEELTKRFFVYDLRAVGSTTTAAPGYPDRDDAQYYDPDTGWVTIGATGVVDWNDVFRPLAMDSDIGNGDNNVSRQFAFSSDGQSIYFVNSLAATGGIFKMNAATGAVQHILQNPGDAPGVEPTVIASSLRNFGGGTGDQILYDGTTTGPSSNPGGINYIVDDGVNVSGPQILLDGERLRNFIGLEPGDTPNIRTITHDNEGNIYFADNTSGSVFMLDTEDRLVAVMNYAQRVAFNTAQSASSQTHRTYYRLQAIEGEHETAGTLTQLLYQSVNAKTIAGINVFKPMDLDRDGQVTLADVLFFQTQYDRTTLPTVADGQAYLDYLKADLTGDSDVNSDRTGLAKASVTQADVKALWQFVRPGDTDVNGVVDAFDLLAASPAFNVAAPQTPGGFSWEEGDWNFDGTVDAFDLLEASPHFNADAPVAVLASVATDAGEAQVIYDANTGEVRISPGDKVGLDSFILASASGVFTGEDMELPGSTIFVTDKDTLVALNFFAPGLTGEVSLGNIMAAGLSEAFLLGDLTLLGGISGQSNFALSLVVIPEPATAIVLVLGGAGVLLRRRR